MTTKIMLFTILWIWNIFRYKYACVERITKSNNTFAKNSSTYASRLFDFIQKRREVDIIQRLPLPIMFCSNSLNLHIINVEIVRMHHFVTLYTIYAWVWDVITSDVQLRPKTLSNIIFMLFTSWNCNVRTWHYTEPVLRVSGKGKRVI